MQGMHGMWGGGMMGGMWIWSVVGIPLIVLLEAVAEVLARARPLVGE